MPALTFGTGNLEKWTAQAVHSAWRAGFDAFDSATGSRPGPAFQYEQAAVGRVLQAVAMDRTEHAGMHRPKPFLVTKIHPLDFGFSRTLDAVMRARSELNVDEIDLVVLHLPFCYAGFSFCAEHAQFGDFVDAWHGLEEAVRQKLVTSIGVSNFDPYYLTRLLDSNPEITPAVADAWVDPFRLPSRALRRLCEDHGIVIRGFSVLGYEWVKARGELDEWNSQGRVNPILEHRTIRKIADRHGTDPAVVVVAYLLHSGIALVVQSRSPERQQAFAATGARGGLSDLLDESELTALADLDGFADVQNNWKNADLYGSMSIDTSWLYNVKRALLSHSSIDGCKKVSNFHRLGFTHVKDVIPAESIASAWRAVRSLLGGEAGDMVHADWEWQLPRNFRAQHPQTTWRFHDQRFFGFSEWVHLAAVFLSPGLLSAIRCIMPTSKLQLIPMSAGLRAKLPKDNRENLGWHRDGDYWNYVGEETNVQERISWMRERTLTVWLPLVDVDVDMGTVVYAPGSDDAEVRVPCLAPTEDGAKAWGSKAQTIAPVSAGDVLLHTASVHHAVWPNTDTRNRVRWHIELHVQDASSPLAFANGFPLPEQVSDLESLASSWADFMLSFHTRQHDWTLSAPTCEEWRGKSLSELARGWGAGVRVRSLLFPCSFCLFLGSFIAAAVSASGAACCRCHSFMLLVLLPVLTGPLLLIAAAGSHCICSEVDCCC